MELCPDLERYDRDAPLTATVDGLLGDHPRIERGSADRTAGRTPRPYGRVPRRRRARFPRLPAAAHHAGGGRARPAAAGRPPAARDVGVRPQPAAGRGVPAADRRQPRQAARHRRRGPAHRLAGPAAAGLPARLRQDDAHGVRRGPARDGPGQGQRAEPRPRRDLPRPGPGARGDRAAEVEKINFALESGSNTLLYLDDIQHTSPELLQKFIPLCDATRRVEGVRDGEPRSYDLRGKRFAVVMAGNPYTESGDAVPDPGHARQPGRRMEPRRGAERPGGRLRAELRGERADRQPGPRPARGPLPRRSGAARAHGVAAPGSPRVPTSWSTPTRRPSWTGSSPSCAICSRPGRRSSR